MTHRREFLAQLGAAASLLAFDADELRAQPTNANGPWDTSWLDRLAAARYRVVFNGNTMSDGEVMSHAATFLDHFHEVHDTTDAQTVPVIVFRRLGTALALNDAMWNRSSSEPRTRWSTRPRTRRRGGMSTGPPQPAAMTRSKIRTLHGRGMISLVCNVALGNVGRSLAEQFTLEAAEVQAMLRANLVPGAILVPSGIYALIRAQGRLCVHAGHLKLTPRRRLGPGRCPSP